MRLIITESQLRLLIETREENLLDFTPFMNAEFDRWDNMFTHLNKKRGGIYTGYYISGYLNLAWTSIETLGNLKSVGGDLYLRYSKIKTLGDLKSVGGHLDLYDTPIESLGNLESVGGILYLNSTPIETLGNLKSVGGDLFLRYTPLSTNTTKDELRNKINIGGEIFL